MFVTDDLLLRCLAASLDAVDVDDLITAVYGGTARCTTGSRDVDYWHRTDTPTQPAATRPAVTICRRCEVAVPCGLLALRRQESWGIWGGMTESHRRRVLGLLRLIGSRQPKRTPAVKTTRAA